MAWKLIYAREGRVEERTLQGSVVKVGRDPSNDIVLQDTGVSVSRFHARFEFDGTQWRVVDTKSTNRVRVNDQLIEPEARGAHVLSDGDRIVLGNFTLRFLREESERLILEEDSVTAKMTQMAVGSVGDLSKLIGQPARLSKEAEGVVERAKRVVSLVTSLSQRVAALTPIEDIIETIVNLVFETTPAERAALFLWDEGAARLIPKRTRVRAGKGSETVSVSESLVQRALLEKVVIQMDPKESPTASMYNLRLRSAIAVPLVHEGKSVGVIYADTSQLSEAFDFFGVSLLSALANHAAIALEQARLVRRVRQEERSRLRLEQYLAKPVVDRILTSSESSPALGMRAEECEVTVLFCDMAGFTVRSEGLPPYGVLSLLNHYFSHMTEAIFEQEGTLDKYIGDCIMAVFGAPCEQLDHARRAARAALGMRAAIRKMNAVQPEGERVGFRIGMHSGRVVAGDVGHNARRDWTVLGATVNLASRLASTIAHTDQIVLTGDTLARLGDGFEVRPIKVEKAPKGITHSFEAYELISVH